MSALSDYLENKIADHIFGGGDFVRPASLHVALYTAGPTDGGGGTEVSGNGYARAAISNNSTNWPAASAGQKSNGTTILFNAATGGGWGTVTHFGIFDAPTSGNLLVHGGLTGSKVIDVNDTPSFPNGTLVFTFA